MKTTIKNAKIACLDINLQKTRMALGVHIQIDDPSQLEQIRAEESKITLTRVKKILASGANVVLTTKGIDDLCLKLFVEAGAIAVRRVLREDMRRVARATGATMVSTLSNLEGEEVFEPSSLGFAEDVSQERIGDDECILIKGTKAHTSASVILRGSNGMPPDEVELMIRLPTRRDGAITTRLSFRHKTDLGKRQCRPRRRRCRNSPLNLPRKLCHLRWLQGTTRHR